MQTTTPTTYRLDCERHDRPALRYRRRDGSGVYEFPGLEQWTVDAATYAEANDKARQIKAETARRGQFGAVIIRNLETGGGWLFRD